MNPHRLVQPLTSAITVKCGDGWILSIVRACFDSLAWEQKIKGWIDFFSPHVINQEKFEVLSLCRAQHLL